MNLKQSALTAAVAATMAMASGQAAAYVYADSALSVDNLVIQLSGTGTVTIGGFLFTETNTATLNGASSPTQSATCGGTPSGNTCSAVPPVLDAQPANAPGSTIIRTNNAGNPSELTSYGTAVGGNYSNSDSVANTAELVQLGSPTSTRQIAESLLTSGATASANAEIQSVTGFQLTFTVTGGTENLSLNFAADPSLSAQILNEVGLLSQANLQTTFTLQSSNGTTVSWTPNGTQAINDCNATLATCTETNDSQDLGISVAQFTNGTNSYSFDPNTLDETLFGINITGLTAGTYTLTLDAITSTQLIRTTAVVPEPGILALLGVGLVGAFASTRRRRKTA
jgi:hypothetical protein